MGWRGGGGCWVGGGGGGGGGGLVSNEMDGQHRLIIHTSSPVPSPDL